MGRSLKECVSLSRLLLKAVGVHSPEGSVCDKGELGVLMGRVRKQLSVAIIRTKPD